MNRELKFRVRDNEQKKFEYFKLSNITIPDRLLSQHTYPVQQYIGLKDKNGKEIYEGDYINFSCNWTVCLGDKDIVEYKNQYVHYDSTIASYVFGHREEFTILDKIMLETIEIVGNEFENPELIGQERLWRIC